MVDLKIGYLLEVAAKATMKQRWHQCSGGTDCTTCGQRIACGAIRVTKVG